jgi:hypothetical protein
MTKRVLAITAAGALLVAIAIAVLCSRARRPSVTRDDAPTPAPRVAATRRTTAAARESEVVAPTSGASPSASDLPDAATSGTERTPASATPSIAGTIVVVDERGGEHAHESGSFVAFFSTGNGWRDERVDVDEGRWAIDLPPNAGFMTGNVRLGDRDATRIGDDEILRATPGTPIEIRARWPAPSILHVRDAATARELSSVQIVEGSSWLWTATHAARDTWRREIADNLASPIDVGSHLADFRGIDDFCARAPGYAWGRILLDLGAGGERFLDLHLGGELDLELRGADDLGDALLVLRRAGVDAPADVANLDHAGLVRVPSLEPGSWTATAQLGRFESPTILGSATADVVAGVTTRVEIDLASPASPDLVTVAGLVRVPKAWGVESLSLTAEHLGNVKRLADRERRGTLDVSESDGAFDVFPFEISDVLPGRWAIEIDEPRFEQSIDVGDDGRDDVVLEVPPPGHASVRVVDAATGDDAPVEMVLWRRTDDDSDATAGCQRDSTTGRFEIDVPQGDLEVSLGPFSTACECEPQRFVVGPGRTEVELRTTAVQGVRLRGLEGDVVIPWDSAWAARLSAIEHDGRETRSQLERGREVVAVTKPGRYRLSIGKIDGRRAVSDREVVVDPGRLTDVVVRLERE